MMKHYDEFDNLIHEVADYKEWHFEKDNRFYLLTLEDSEGLPSSSHNSYGKESRVFLYNLSDDKAVAFVFNEDVCNHVFIPDSFKGRQIVGVYLYEVKGRLRLPQPVECVLGMENIKRCPEKDLHDKVWDRRPFSNSFFVNRSKDFLYSSDGEDLLFAEIKETSNSQNTVNSVQSALKGVKVIHNLNIDCELIDLVIPRTVEKIIKIHGSCKSISFEGVIPDLSPKALDSLYLSTNTVCVLTSKKDSGVVKMDSLYNHVHYDRTPINEILYAPAPHTVDKCATPGYITLTSELDGKTIMVNAKYVGAVVPCSYACAEVSDDGNAKKGYVEGAKVLVVIMANRNEVGTWLNVYESVSEVDAKLAEARE